MRNFDWGYILEEDICSCYWEEPELPPILDCILPEGENYQPSLFDTTVFDPRENRQRNLVNEIGKFGHFANSWKEWRSHLTTVIQIHIVKRADAIDLFIHLYGDDVEKDDFLSDFDDP